MKIGPIVLALVAILAVGSVALFRNAPAVESPESVRSSPESCCPVNPDAPASAASTSPSSAPKAPPAKPAPLGSLRVSVVGLEARIGGRVVVLDEKMQREADLPVAGGTRVDLPPRRLKVGPKTVLYLHEGPAYGSASATTTIEKNATAEVSLTLKAATTLSGIAVDSLQRPLPGVTVQVLLPPLFASEKPGNPDYPLWSKQETFGRSSVTSSVGVLADGSVLRSATTGPDGVFDLDGVEGGALTVEVSYKDVRLTQACRPGAENRIVMPVLFETPLPDLGEQQFKQRLRDLHQEVGRHPEAAEPWYAQIRDLLHARVDAARISEKERASLKQRIEGIGRPVQGR